MEERLPTFIRLLFENEIFRLITVLFSTFLVGFLAKKIIVEAVRRFFRHHHSEYDKLFSRYKIYDIIIYISAIIVLYYVAHFLPHFESFIKKFVSVSLVLVVTLLITRFLSIGLVLYEHHPMSKRHPIKGYVQIIKSFIYITAGITILCYLFEKSPWAFLSGLGALSAVILLIFRHTLLSFVASFQIVSQDLFHIGDWIEMPQYGADGEVIEIALHTIKIQNWDRTIVVIPTYKFLEESFKNWRGMELAGGRRIKRAILVDQSSIKLCDGHLIARLKTIHLLEDYLREKLREIESYNKAHGVDTDLSILNGVQLTNIGVFRVYIENYLRNHPKIRKDMTIMVRQLLPTPYGLPLEIYCFVADTRWVYYERIQAEIFDHILSVAGEFDLRIYQMPTSWDLREGIKVLRDAGRGI